MAFGQNHEQYGALLTLLEEAQRGDYFVSCVAGFHLTQRNFQEHETLSFKQLGFCQCEKPILETDPLMFFPLLCAEFSGWTLGVKFQEWIPTIITISTISRLRLMNLIIPYLKRASQFYQWLFLFPLKGGR